MKTAIALRWLREARIGDQMCYHRGMLAVDRERITIDSKIEKVEPTDSTASAMYQAYEDGLAILFQKRDPAGGFHYLARKIARVRDDYGRPKSKRAGR